MKALLVMLAVVGCRREFEWHGIPSGPSTGAVCTRSGENLDLLMCVADGKAYTCVRDWDRSVVECALIPIVFGGAPMPTESM